MKDIVLMTVAALAVGSTCCSLGADMQTETSQVDMKAKQMSKPVEEDWGPFAKPWKRYDKNPIVKLEGNEKYQVQNGPQTVIQWKGKWYMFLMGALPMRTMLAVSDDGLTWERPHHNYLLEPTMEWEGGYNLAKAAVIRDDEVWLYYFGKKGKTEMIALARSKDLVDWKKQPEPIFTHKDSRIPSTRMFPDCVLRHKDTWYMYYDVGVDYAHPNYPNYVIGVATSKDGITWTDSEKSPVLTGPDPKSKAWDTAVCQASVVKIGDWFYMLYSGSMGSKNNGMSFGLARAKHPEGPWEKYPNNPVFSQTGKAEDFDAQFLQHACPVKVGKQWRIYYNGNRAVPKSKARPVGGEYAVGLAFTEE